MPNELFWESTPREVEEVLRLHAEDNKAAYLRAGLVAATIVNVNRKKGARLVRPTDFIKEAPKATDYMDLPTASRMLDKWAAAENARQQERARRDRDKAMEIEA